MQIYKFGGASIKSPKALSNILKIVSDKNEMVIVVSAIDKTTNKLEKLVNSCYNSKDETILLFNKIKDFHINFAKEALSTNYDKIEDNLNKIFESLLQQISDTDKSDYDKFYDAVVSHGELLSSQILSTYLNYNNKHNILVDIRKVIVTDSNHRDAKILWEESQINTDKVFNSSHIFVTQGFIGQSKQQLSTTLGREGSDYTASALAYLLNAKDVTIWKDVSGIMNADPEWCSFAQKLDIISFNEAIELAFYGAKIIHPKTIKPIENKNIPLFVKPFNSPNDTGTKITKLDYKLNLLPIYILKENQILLSISPKDFSFVVEENISELFALFYKYKIKVNISQNSAISFSIALDGKNRNFNNLLDDLKNKYFIKYNTGLDLITIRYYTEEAIAKMTNNRKILLEQRSRNTARFVLK